MKAELRPLIDFGLEKAVALMNLGFSDYYFPFELTLSRFLHMAGVESIDLDSSRVSYLGEEAVGIALIARRGWTSRLASMCIIPAARRHGAGRIAMHILLDEAAARGDHGMVLEVIESNQPAVRLYEGVGFQTDRRLVSFMWTSPAVEAADTAALQEIDIREVARQVILYGLPNLPWQISGESMAQSGPPVRAFGLQDACAVISNPAAERIAILSMVVKPEARGQHQATRLLEAVLARYPDRQWAIPALCPEEVGGFFEKAGFTPDSLSQLQMSIRIEPQQKL